MRLVKIVHIGCTLTPLVFQCEWPEGVPNCVYNELNSLMSHIWVSFVCNITSLCIDSECKYLHSFSMCAASTASNRGVLQTSTAKLDLKEPYYRMTQSPAYAWSQQEQHAQQQVIPPLLLWVIQWKVCWCVWWDVSRMRKFCGVTLEHCLAT